MSQLSKKSKILTRRLRMSDMFVAREQRKKLIGHCDTRRSLYIMTHIRYGPSVLLGNLGK